MSDNQHSVLIIDDDPDLTELLRLLLEEHHLEVDTLHDGIDALELRRPYDVILLDLNMPVFDGERLIDYWQVTRPEILSRVIVLSGYARRASDRTLITFATMLKPVEPRELLRLVDVCMRQT